MHSVHPADEADQRSSASVAEGGTVVLLIPARAHSSL
jgi:hypothetical protein